MGFSIFLLLLGAGLAGVGVLLPRKWLHAFLGWYALAVGLLLLDHMTVAGRTAAISLPMLGYWAVFGLAAFILRKTIDARRGVRPPALDLDQRILLGWEPPIAILLAFLAMHAFSNGLAGLLPAWLAHFLPIVAVGVVLGVLLHSLTESGRPRFGVSLFLGTFLIMVTVVVGAGANQAVRLSRRASVFADGMPYCLLTYDNSGRARAATSTLDLSPVVMRSGGAYAAYREPWLVVRDRFGVASYRFLPAGRRFVVAESPRPFACDPA